MKMVQSQPYLALGLGGYLLFSAAGVLVPKTAVRDRVEALRTSKGLAHLTGAVAFFVGGGLLAVVRPGFSSWEDVLISLTAIWWLVEGAAALSASQFILARRDAPRHFYRMNLVALPVGAALLVAGVIDLR